MSFNQCRSDGRELIVNIKIIKFNTNNFNNYIVGK